MTQKIYIDVLAGWGIAIAGAITKNWYLLALGATISLTPNAPTGK